MLQHASEQRNALAGRQPLSGADRLSITVAPDCARFSLRTGPDGRDGAGRAFGCALPDRIGGLSRAGDLTALCLGPDEWVLLAPAAEAEGIESRFAAVAASHSLVDVSHREVGLDVRGTGAASALSATCALDLAAMPAPSATRTILDRAQVVLVKHAPDHYRVEVWQSFATHVWGLLTMAAREIDLDI